VGEGVAQWSEPERIKWSRAGTDERKQGGTLVIRVTSGRALDLQHETPRIIERINAFYGYAAIAAIKIRQGALSRKMVPSPTLPALGAQAAQALENELEGVADPGLKDALRRLGEGVLSPRSPQSK
jgi:hypothetical protein